MQDAVTGHVLRAMEQNIKPSIDELANPDSNDTWKQLVLPSSLQSEVLKQIHAGSVGGHLGQSKTLQKLRDQFYWPGHYNDVMMWCASCPSCSTRKSPSPKAKAPLKPILIGHPMQLVAADLLGLFHAARMATHILAATNYFTKWCEAYALPNMEAVTVAKALTNKN
uniref:Integrase zinc-binding domain-containing protein n=1 Tax=Amphimedon queenslandica TaxID=400682 RepID=A0A1X7TH70_AMPQE